MELFASASHSTKEQQSVCFLEANMTEEEVKTHPEFVKRVAAMSLKVIRSGKEVMKQMRALSEFAGVRPVETLPCCELLLLV